MSGDVITTALIIPGASNTVSLALSVSSGVPFPGKKLGRTDPELEGVGGGGGGHGGGDRGGGGGVLVGADEQRLIKTG